MVTAYFNSIAKNKILMTISLVGGLTVNTTKDNSFYALDSLKHTL